MLDLFSQFGLAGKNAMIIVAAMLPIINPVGGAPIFLSMTKDVKGEAAQYLARAIAVNTIIISAASMLFGSYILAFFGISEAALRIAGGILVIATGWRLLHANDPEVKTDVDEAGLGDISSAKHRAFYPLTFPLTMGPGAIAVSITLGARVWSDKSNLAAAAIGAALGIAITGGLVYICYRFARGMLRGLGDTGAQVLLRFAAFILLCIGVQIAWEGIAQLLKQVGV